MTWVIVLVSIALIFQIVLFVLGRKMRKREKENNVVLKYNINSRQKAWQLIADPSTPEEDRVKIKELYEAEDD